MQLIALLREKGIRISVVDGGLEVDAPKGALDDELRNAIVANKPDLLRLLSWSRRSLQATNIPLEPVSREGRLPLSWAQQRLWFLDQLEPGNPAYNISWTVRLRGDLNAAALGEAFSALLQRHEILRTVFPVTDGEPEQRVLDDSRLQIERIDLRNVADEQLRARLAELAGYHFSLAEELLIRPTLIQLAEDEHILLVVVHHIVADGASMRILFRELAAFYEGQTAQGVTEPEGIAELPLQYADFAVWQRSWLDSDELDRQSAYWRSRLDGLPPLLELPTDRPRAAAMRYRGASVLKVLPADLAADLRRLSRDHGCTLFMTMLTAFFVLLMRYSGRDDLVVGTPLGGRSRTSLEGLIGFFVNTVVLRADLSGNPGFGDLLQRVRDVALEAHANQDLPFEKLVEIIQPERELSHSPVFQVMFDLQEEPRWKLPVRSLEVVPEVVFSSRTSSFDLTLSVRQAEQGLDAMFEYDTDLFDESSIESMASHYRTLLEAVVADASQAIAELPLVDPATERQQVHAWNTATLPYPQEKSIAELFAEQVEQQGESEALRDGARTYSYAQLNAVANAVAFRLLDTGLLPDIPVAVCARHSAEAFIATLAIHKAGGCVVPLDPSYPAERLRFMLSDSGANLLLYQSADKALAESLLDGLDCRGMALSTSACAPGSGSQNNPPVAAGARNLAYLMYTSGTTGVPKGAELEHRGFVNYIGWLIAETGLSAADTVLQFASPSFDIAIEESLAALLSGATLVLREPRMSQSVADFITGCLQHDITWLSLPTAWWHELSEAMHRKDVVLPASLRAVVIGGEKAELEALRKWHHRAPGVRLFNTYGPTESTIAVACSELTHLDPESLGEVPLGYPVPNTRVWIMDDMQRPVPPGLPGEVCVGGPGVARGYRNRAELSAERFVSVVLPDGSRDRLYRTGDRARYVAGSGLLFMGRVDGQIKLRGHRIEPAEIEAVLAAMPGAGRCAVVPRGHGSALQIVAYVTGEADPQALHEALRERLPDYMVPAAVIHLVRLPFTENGKLDRGALPELQVNAGSSGDYCPPVTAVQKALAGIWANVLDIAEPGIRDDFFRLGGHSLVATRVIARVRDTFGSAVPLRALFDHPTIERLAQVVEKAAAVDGGIELAAGAASDLAPLSWAQQRLWLLDELEADNTAYNLYSATELTGELNRQALQTAIDRVVARHAVLRTVFTEHSGAAVQVSRDTLHVPVQLQEMEGVDDSALQAALTDLIDEPFALGAGPLLRVHLLRLDSRRHVLLLILHHIVADGWSMAVMFRELQAHYAVACGADSNQLLPDLPLQYVDYSQWQRDRFEAGELNAAEAYWQKQLSGAPPFLPLPADNARPPVQTHSGHWVNRQLDSSVLAQLQALATDESASLFMVLLSAFKALLLRHTGVTDLLVGTPVAGRTRTELEPLIGCFLNTLVLRTSVSDDPTFAHMLSAVRRTTLDAYEHQDLPFERLLELLQPPRTPAYTPLVQVMFNLHNERGDNLMLEGLHSRPVLTDRAAAKFDLSVSVAENSDGLLVGFEYNCDLYDEATMAEMLDDYVLLLEAFVADRQQKVSTVELTAAPTSSSVSELAFDPLQYVSIDARFREVARRCHGNAAVQSDGRTYSYAELDQWCDAVAAALPVVTGSNDRPLLGLMLGHDAAMAAGVLGALRAGYAYVPIDASLPAKRLHAILELTGIETLLVAREFSGPAVNLHDRGVSVVFMPKADAPPVSVSPLTESSSDELAYVLFTSGTTGVPKGVTQTQANVLHHAAVYSASISVQTSDRLAQFAQFGFDAAVMDIYGALLNGACLVPLDVTQIEITDACEAMASISILHATPTVFRYLVDHLPGGQNIAGVRAVVLGGEKAAYDDFIRVRERFANDTLFINGLGPSESTMALQFRAVSGTRIRGRQVPVGTAVAGAEVLLLDEHGQAAGLRGEIVIRSPHVSPGYWRQPQLTAQRMRDDMYFTGDRARRLPDGQLLYEGRLDAQVQIHGRRIEPAEITHALAGLDGVSACTAFAVGPTLVACYTGSADAEVLRATLRGLLPHWLVPARIERVAELPLKANGKVDNAALADALPDAADTGGRAPDTPAEQQIVALFAELLGVEQVSVDSDFFLFGGHSLLAMQLISRLRDQFAVSLRLADVFAAPTPAQLALRVSVQPSDADEVRLERRPADTALPPLSWAQQRLWFLDRLEPENAAYNLHWAAELDGIPDEAALGTALADVVARHESLRTAFVEHAGVPAQLIHSVTDIPLVIEAMPGADSADLQRRLLELIRRPFDLRQAPLLKAYLLKTAEDRSVLLLVLHHIVADGWSMGLLFNDLSRCYTARVSGQCPDLGELPVQYADYSVWQQRWLAGAELERQQAYWLQKLDGAPPLLELPLDKTRPPVQRFRGAWANTTFDRALLDGIRNLAENRSATVFMVILAAFKVLLMRHTGSSDIVVGAPVAGRNRTGVEKLIGFFLNTLVLRTEINSDASFADALHAVRQTTLEAYDHQELPFEKLLELLQPPRSTSHAPLVQVTINLHNEPGASLSLAELGAEVLTIDRGTAKFDLALSLVETSQGLQAGFEYNTDLFAADTAQNLLQQLGDLLQAFVADPEMSVCSPCLSDATNRVSIDRDHRSLPVHVDQGTISEQIARVVAACPDHAAVVTDASVLNYAQLAAQSAAVAAAITQALRAVEDSQEQVRVALWLGHDSHAIIALTAVLEAGHTYVPLDTHAPAARQAKILDIAKPRLLISDQRHIGSVPDLPDGCALLLLEDAFATEPLAEPARRTSPDDLAYLLFTSGTTGEPKAVMQTHANVLRHIRAYSDALKIADDDRLTLLAALGFDAAVMDVYGALLNGAALFPLELRAEDYPGQTLDRMSSAGITVLHATPTVYRFLMRSKVCRHELDDVRAVVLGGEEVHASDFELFRRQFAPPAVFVNGLGPSESTLAAQFFADHNTRLPGGVVPVGDAVAGTELRLLNEAGESTDLMGELVIISDAVAPGYWNDPELTSQRFEMLPDGRTCYRSGDLARRLPDGSLVFVGRVDSQIKLRGVRIEPAEIEAALAECEGVRDAVVLLHEDAYTGDSRLVAWYTGTALAQGLRRELRERLPDFMVPSACILLPALPLTANGKLDRKRLPEPGREATVDGYVAPESATERQLQRIWADVLGLNRVGVQDDFFDLGGHSLLAAQLAARVNESMQVTVPLRRLFDEPTIRALAAHIDNVRWVSNAGD